MFLQLLALFVASDPDTFDRFERRHYDNTRAQCYSHLTANTKTLRVQSSFYKGGEDHFRECQTFDTVEIEADITEIYPYSFYGSSAKTVNFLGSSEVQSIGVGAFAFCNQLTTINLPSKVQYIDEGAFFSSSLTTPSFSNCQDLISIGNSAYEKSLVKGEITFSGKNNLASIGERAFYGTSITKITAFPENIAIEKYAFAQCSSLTAIPATITATSINQFAFDGCIALTGSVQITATSIGEHAFHKTGALQIGKIAQREATGNTLLGISISDYAFSGKTITGNIDFSTVSAGYSISIGPFAFFKCIFNCQSINLESASLDEYCFANATFAVATSCKLTLNTNQVPAHAFECTTGIPLEIQTKGDHLLNAGEFSFYHSHVSTTGDSQLYLSNAAKKAFAHCPNLRGIVNISGTNSDVGAYAFGNCTNLKGPLILNCKDIGESAFEFCTSLASFNMTENHIEGTATDPDRKIGDRAFYACGLNSDLILHSFVSEIGEYAFARCTKLGKITIFSETISSYAFAECGTLNGPITIYSNDIHFHAFDKTTIGTLIIDTKYDHDADHYIVHNQAFYGITFNGPVYIREHVTVSNFAFNRATFDKLLLIDASSIGAYSFAECGAKSECNVSIGETEIGNHAFEYFGRSVSRLSLEFHALAEPTHAIGIAAFNTSGFTNALAIPRYFTSIGNDGFRNVPITSVNIHVGDSSDTFEIGESSFEGSSITLLSITSDGAAVSIKKRAFYATKINQELIMPVYLSYVGEEAFESCTQLRGVVFNYNDNSLTEIDNSAFCNCENLRGEIYIPSHVNRIGQHAFENCPLLNRLTLILDGSLTNIDDYAFAGCQALDNSIDIPYLVTYIGDYAFYNCKKIGDHLSVKTELQYPGQTNQYCTIGSHAFEGCTELKTLDFVPTHNEELNYYSKLRYIEDYAFYGSGIIGTLYLPYSLYEIGASAFKECAISGQLVFHDELGIIGDSAFENCRGIVHISFDNPEDDDGSELNIGAKAFYHTSLTGTIGFANRIYTIGESAFEDCTQITNVEFIDYVNPTNRENHLRILNNAFKNTGITGYLVIPERTGVKNYDSVYSVGYNSFANCAKINHVIIHGGEFSGYVFENCTSINNVTMTDGTLGRYNFVGCQNNITISLYDNPYIGDYAFADYQEGFLFLKLKYVVYDDDEFGFDSLTSLGFGEKCFYNSFLNGSLYLLSETTEIKEGAFASCQYLLGDLILSPQVIYQDAFADSIFNGSLYIDLNGFTTAPTTFAINYFRRSTGFINLTIVGKTGATPQVSIGNYAFAGMGFPDGILRIGIEITTIGKYAFAGCGFYRVDFDYSGTNQHRSNGFSLSEGTFYNCAQINTTVDLSQCNFGSISGSTNILLIPPRLFHGCSRMPFIIFKDLSPPPTPAQSYAIGNEAFRGCSSLYIHSDFFLVLSSVGIHAFSGCSSLNGSVYISSNLNHIDEYAFSDCTGFSGRMTIHVNPTSHKYIGPSAFSGCKGFKNGKLYIFIDSNEENDYNVDTANGLDYSRIEGGFRPYYKYNYFLTIGNEAFEETKFKNIYYNGRFQPECDYDIGFSHTKGIHTSSNYVNKTFCNYPLHSSKLSGGGIAGITIAVIVVVAVIVFLIIFFILRNKKKKDNSEDEVEMNADP